MDIGIASAAVALLAPYFSSAISSAAEEAGKSAYHLGERVFQAIKGKFTSRANSYGQMTLQRLEEKPEDEARQSALAGVLAEEAADDAVFAESLQRLVEEARGSEQVTQFLTHVYGNARVDKLFNIGTVKTQTFNG